MKRKLTKNEILTIIDNQFLEIIIDEITESIQNNEIEGLEGQFDTVVDDYEVDYINNYDIYDLTYEDDEDLGIYYGEIILDVAIDGIAYFEGEHIVVGTTDIEFVKNFSFTTTGKICDNFQIN